MHSESRSDLKRKRHRELKSIFKTDIDDKSHHEAVISHSTVGIQSLVPKSVTCQVIDISHSDTGAGIYAPVTSVSPRRTSPKKIICRRRTNSRSSVHIIAEIHSEVSLKELIPAETVLIGRIKTSHSYTEAHRTGMVFHHPVMRLMRTIVRFRTMLFCRKQSLGGQNNQKNCQDALHNRLETEYC